MNRTMDKVVTVKCDSRCGFVSETNYYLSKGYEFVSAGYTPACFSSSNVMMNYYDKPCWWAVMEYKEVAE